jgi:hypothetical protein
MKKIIFILMLIIFLFTNIIFCNLFVVQNHVIEIQQEIIIELETQNNIPQIASEKVNAIIKMEDSKTGEITIRKEVINNFRETGETKK